MYNCFQIDSIPCHHALAVIGERGDQPYNYCSQYYKKDSYFTTYIGCVILVDDFTQRKDGNYRAHDEIYLPKSKRQPCRPKCTRRRTRAEYLKATICRRCGGRGHNRRTCKQLLPICQLGKNKRGLSWYSNYWCGVTLGFIWTVRLHDITFVGTCTFWKINTSSRSNKRFSLWMDTCMFWLIEYENFIILDALIFWHCSIIFFGLIFSYQL